MTWRSKKQDIAEAEYKAMTHTACEMIWLKYLLAELDFRQLGPMLMHCDNQVAIYIVQNPIFHKRIKHIGVDCHFVRYGWTQEGGYFPVHPFFEAVSRFSYQNCLTSGIF